MKKYLLSFAVMGALAVGAGFMVMGGDGGSGKENESDDSTEVIEKSSHRRFDVPAPVGGASTVAAAPTGQAVSQFGIQYHNGPVMASGMNVYIIWYGTHLDNTKTNLKTLVANIGNTPYWNINKTYTTAGGVALSGAVTFKKEVVNTGTATSLSDAAIQNIVAAHLALPSTNANYLPRDVNGIYLVLTGTNVTASSGFCTQYCGWHTHFSNGGIDIKYSFVGSVSRCPTSCAAQNPGPNNDLNTDGMASIIAHEMEETLTDPDLNAWWQTSTGMENADKCAWTFGSLLGGTGNGKYNMNFGGKNWYIQQNWKNVAPAGACAKQ